MSVAFQTKESSYLEMPRVYLVTPETASTESMGQVDSRVIRNIFDLPHPELIDKNEWPKAKTSIELSDQEKADQLEYERYGLVLKQANEDEVATLEVMGFHIDENGDLQVVITDEQENLEIEARLREKFTLIETRMAEIISLRSMGFSVDKAEGF